jgi:hypothetical protein
MGQLHLPAVFWPGHSDESAPATCYVEDALVIYIQRADGLQVRLLFHELEALYDFAVDEIGLQGGFDDEPGEETEDEVPSRIVP